MIPTAIDEPGTLVLPSVAGLDGLSDAQLEQRQRDFAAARRQVEAGAALVAAEVARRSARDLGQSSLAAREGARSAERLIERWAGVSPREAVAMVRVGELLAVDEVQDAVAGSGGPTWLSAVTSAVAQGALSVLAADAIRAGLGEPADGVPEADLAAAAEFLVSIAGDVPLRRLAAEARALRDSLDADGILDRERAMRDRRYLRLTPQDDGMTRITGLLDPESAAIVSSAFDDVTAPRRGGPRFVDPVAVERAQRIVDDPRTTEQLLVDSFVEMVRIAGAADEGKLFSQRRPAVQLQVDRTDFDSGCGGAHLEGQTVAVSMRTAHRWACACGSVPILFDGVDPIDVGRAQRTFTARQRVALAARDGGCVFPGCDRPASWTEAHHADEWDADQGPTDLINGVLLCRFHHMLIHDQGWHIERRGSTFFAKPPPGSNRAELVLASRNPVNRMRR
jgi:hypothetical protein